MGRCSPINDCTHQHINRLPLTPPFFFFSPSVWGRELFFSSARCGSTPWITPASGWTRPCLLPPGGRHNRDQAKVQGLSRGAEVGSCANPAGLAGKGKELLYETPTPTPPSLLWKMEVESRRRGNSTEMMSWLKSQKVKSQKTNRCFILFSEKKILCRRTKLINGHDEDELPAAEKTN